MGTSPCDAASFLARVVCVHRREHQRVLHLATGARSADELAAAGAASARGEDIPEFGPDVTAAFCAANDVAIIVRAHQYVRQGDKVMHGGRLVTLFSARNYFSSGKVCNDGALLLVAPDGNGHLRLHAKRLAYLSSHAEVPNDGDWRLWLLGSMAKCLQVPSMGR